LRVEKYANEAETVSVCFYPRDAMLARVIAIATCLSVRLTRAGIVSKRRKLASWFLHHLVAPWL